MIEGYRPGPVRVDPVGVAPAEVVALALRCERLEAVAEAAREYREAERQLWSDATAALTIEAAAEVGQSWEAARDTLDAALVAAGATGKAGT